MITNADKGNITVAMYKRDYEEKTKDILRDRTTYRILRQDPTTKLQQTNNSLVEKLFNEKVITMREKK